MQPLIILKPFLHRSGEKIGIYFENFESINILLRKKAGAKWSQSGKCWHVPLTEKSYKQICEAIKDKAEINSAALKEYLDKRKIASKQILQVPEIKIRSIVQVTEKLPAKISKGNQEALNRYIQQLTLKAYGASTIRTYRNEFIQLLQLIKNKPVQDLTTDDLRRYMVYCYEKLNLTENTLHSRINALKFYFEQVLGREKFFWELPRPKKQFLLPRFFNQDEITAIIKAAGNIKHRTMLMLAYSSGLRVSEVVSLKTNDIDRNRMCILIRQAKGKKDRMVVLSPVLLVMLREYENKVKPEKQGYLFQGQYKEEPYSTRSLQLVLAAAKTKAGILKPGSIHALRHSFATHLLDKGTDVTMIMKLLGHNDIKTTLRYLHVTNRDMLQIISPLDDLKLD
jgi:integrase/recombinase XerD